MTRRPYDKANSILQLRGGLHSSETILEGVRALLASMNASPSPEGGYRHSVIKRACHDLLGMPAVTGAPRFALKPHVVEELSQVDPADLGRYLFYRYRYDTFPQTHELDDFPPCVQIEPTSICNYRCVFCYQTDSELTNPSNGHMGMMSLDLFKRVIDGLEGHCEAVTLASRGEPLICKDIESMIRYLGGKFLASKINTNGWFLDERKAHAILESGIVTLVVSADAATEPAYSQFRVNGKLDRVLENVRQFRDIRERHYPQSRIITRVSGVRYSESQNLDEMEAFWGELVDQVAFVDYVSWENVYEHPLSGIEKPCSDLWRRMFVWNSGVVNPCDVDYRSTLAVGDAAKVSLSALWTGEPYSSYRRQHLAGQRGDSSPCNRCEVV